MICTTYEKSSVCACYGTVLSCIQLSYGFNDIVSLPESSEYLYLTWTHQLCEHQGIQSDNLFYNKEMKHARCSCKP